MRNLKVDGDAAVSYVIARAHRGYELPTPRATLTIDAAHLAAVETEVKHCFTASELMFLGGGFGMALESVVEVQRAARRRGVPADMVALYHDTVEHPDVPMRGAKHIWACVRRNRTGALTPLGARVILFGWDHRGEDVCESDLSFESWFAHAVRVRSHSELDELAARVRGLAPVIEIILRSKVVVETLSTRVRHAAFGEGTVRRSLASDKFEIEFDDGTVRVLLARFVEQVS